MATKPSDAGYTHRNRVPPRRIPPDSRCEGAKPTTKWLSEDHVRTKLGHQETSKPTSPVGQVEHPILRQHAASLPQLLHIRVLHPRAWMVRRSRSV